MKIALLGLLNLNVNIVSVLGRFSHIWAMLLYSLIVLLPVRNPR